ncbi:glycoside hydrolase family 3 N-terminal domain-containing protein [Kitasatospora sp. MBT63]|uniref:glycoside hydrolase family 3 N-terminal domain-containing protein n=1 Tax=Kitasatospora sp. MBT63 TaxID=1444768 RepID=UPI0006911E0D|nr:glycoside hydrolase family 3 N-terminal domain-containing protein [Kitasatospora sp. MBT63]
MRAPVPTRWTVTALALLLVAVAAAAAPSPPAGPTARQLAGQRVIYSYQGLVPPEDLLAEIRGGRAAGVIFFKDNYADARQFGSAVRQLREARRTSGVRTPLLLMTDQEGGPVRRVPGAPELSARAVGSSADPRAAAASAGSGAGKNLAGLALNVNLAPVLDVYRTPGNFIDRKERSFSSDPQAVAELGGTFLTAQQRTGVAATAKHFPGLGTAATAENTDLAPVTLPVDEATLRTVDEAPYRAAVAAGVRLVMLSWAVYPALDADRPAGLSPAVVGQELRGRLGFRGVTLSDALEAGALRDFGDTGHRAVAAATAGVDLLLCSSGDPAQGRDATTALADALASGRLDPAAFALATHRIADLQAHLA